MMLLPLPPSPVPDAALLKAIEILVSPVWGALSTCHALGGYPSEEWAVLENFTPRQIVDEIIERGLSLDGRLAACSRVLVTDTGVSYDPRLRSEAEMLPVLPYPSRT